MTIALLLLAVTARSATIAEFTPRGAQLAADQVRAVFSTAMVPVGHPEAAAPFEVHCPAPGRERWADKRTWVYDLDKPLPGGETCGFRLRPEPTGGRGRPDVRLFSPETAWLVGDILSDRQARALAFGLENPLATR